MIKPHVYLASGWFNEKQKEQMDEVYRVLLDLSLRGELDFFSPFYDGIVLKGKSDPDWRKKMKEVWELDIAKVEASNLIIGCTQDHDVGTIFELGYASAKGIPILCYNSNPELGLNVMLSQEARGFIKSPSELESALLNFCAIHFDSPASINQWSWNDFNGEPI